MPRKLTKGDQKQKSKTNHTSICTMRNEQKNGPFQLFLR